MLAPPQAPPCPLCGQELSAGASGCPQCRAPAEALDLVAALDFVARRFEQWHKEGLIKPGQQQHIAEYYRRQRQDLADKLQAGAPAVVDLPLLPAHQCWRCLTPRQRDALCERCGAPLQAPAARSLRYLTALLEEITRHEQAHRLSLSQAHALLSDTRERIQALRRRLEQDRVPVVRLAPAPQPRDVPYAEVAEPRRPLVERILDPKNIQMLLTFGGGLLVLGLIIWLATAGVFNSRVIAMLLGAANAAILLGGWALIRMTRYQTAGRALTLLACLVMPLNLWYYDAHQIITLDGRLWLAALVCCGLYAASAVVVRDPLFVYVLMAGLAMTGLLILADRDVQRFWEVAAPATLLVGLGVVAIFAERLFPEGEGSFTRRSFGLAFFWSGHALLAAGLLFVLSVQLVSWAGPTLAFRGAVGSAIVTDQALKIHVMLLFAVGAVVYLYSDLVVRRIGVYLYAAAFCLLWAEVLLLNLFDNVPSEVILVVLAGTGAAVHLLHAWSGQDNKVTRALPALGLLLCAVPVLWAVALHVRATWPELRGVWRRASGAEFVTTWEYVGALLVTALACRLGAFVYRRAIPTLSVIYFFLTGAATLVGAAGLASLIGLKTWDEQAPALMLLPIAYLVAARLYRGRTPEWPLVMVAHAATGVMLFAVLCAATESRASEVLMPLSGTRVNLLLALFFAEAAVFYLLAAGWGQGVNIYLATAAACGAVWQMLHYLQVPGEYHAVGFALVGMALLIAYRSSVLDRYSLSNLANALFACANALLVLASVAGLMLTVGRLGLSMRALEEMGGGDWQVPVRRLLVALGILTALSLVAAALVRHADWRRLHVIMALLEVTMTLLVLNFYFSLMTPWQKAQLVFVVMGLVLLLLGHWGWYRESEERQSDLVTLSLVLGSLAVAVPMAFAVLYHRSTASFSTHNEVGLLVLGLLMLATGVMFQIKSTAISGGVMVGLYVITLPMFLRQPAWIEKLEDASLWMIFGGGSVFLIGLVLSLFRDRLLALPEKIRRREGLFRLLNWR